MKHGIHSIGIAVPPTYIDLAELAAARGVAPEKYTVGLGIERMGVPQPDEDTVTLAARAGRMALDAAGGDPADLGLVAVGTETAVDHSKPVASFVQGLLRLPTGCRIVETKHACYGGTAALQLALDWLRASGGKRERALVICSDIARYGLGTPGEPTQGAGAVAMVLGADPALVALEPGAGIYSEDVFDFWRPLYRKDAIVDGQYSVECYLKALRGAYRAYLSRYGAKEGQRFSDRYSALAYHVPYGKMARKAHAALRALDGDERPEATFGRLVEPGLQMCSQVGNIYAGSLYLALASQLVCTNDDLDGRAVGLFSYGSGCCAEFFTGVVQPGAQERLRRVGLLDVLERRRKLSIPEYEALMNDREGIDERAAEDTGGKGFRYLGVREHRRVYAR